MTVWLSDVLLGWAKHAIAMRAQAGVRFLVGVIFGLFINLLIHPAQAAPEKSINLSFTHILPDQLEAIGHISDVVMDNQGFMWFGGNSGLARYDGYQLVIYRHNATLPRSLGNNAVNRLLVTQDGILWVGTEAGLSRYYPETDDFSVYHHVSNEAAHGTCDSIRALLEDKQGRLWLGTNCGLVEFARDSNQLLAHWDVAKARIKDGNSSIWSLALDQQGKLWLGTQSEGLVRYDPQTQEQIFFHHDPQIESSLSANDVRTVYVDSHNRVWAGTYLGTVNLLDVAATGFSHYSQPKGVRSDVIWSIIQDRDGRLWVGDGGGISLLQPDNPVLNRFSYNEFEPSSPGNFVVRCIYEDRAGDIWLGYFPSGVDRLDNQASAFRNYRHTTFPNSISDGGVLATLEDDQHNLWVGTGFGLSYLDRKQGTFTRYYHQPDNPNSLAGNTSLSLALDRHQQLWVGSWSKGLNRMDLRSGKIERYSYDPNNPNSLLGREPWRILEDSRGNIWVATEMGISRYNPDTNDFTRFLPQDSQKNGSGWLYTRVIYEDRQQQLWVGSDRGLFLLDRDSGEFTRYYHVEGHDASLSDDMVLAIYEDRRGNFWIGTHAGGLNLFNRNTRSFQAIGLQQGLTSDSISSITEDLTGNLWLTTQGGIAQYDIDTRQFRHFDKRHGLMDNLFNRNTALLTSWGEVAFGSTKGLTLLDPEQLKMNTYVPPVVFTGLQIFNRTITPGTAESPLHTAIGMTRELTLHHEQSVFSFEFAALSYRLADQNQYSYRLEGFDDNWHEVGNRRSATYTNLNAGDYIFRVHASNNDGIWNEQGASIQVHVLPSPWRTWWAYSIYCALAIMLAFILIQMQLRKMELQHAKSVNAQLKKFDKIKDSFLANTSHELRTPLNGIIGLTESLIDTSEHSFATDVLAKLRMIRASGKRLATLVNDILDYSKLAEHSLDIKLHPVNCHMIAQEVVALLQGLADGKGLELINQIDVDTPWVLADENRLQQILINLLGNAIKYSEKGTVTLSTTTDDGQITFKVTDTGLGIRQEDLDRVFIAFQQLDAEDDRVNSGTGLGLAITKQLVELHGGTIAVESTFGEGSTFSFNLRTTARAVDLATQQPAKASPKLAVPQSPPASQVNAELVQRDKQNIPPLLLAQPESFRVLIVDDDPVNRMVLKGILKLHRYQVLEANSGQQALDCVAKQAVDLIILDVMMPLMSGFDVCKKLRETYCLEELPIIFLTAKNLDDDLPKGFAVGGNDFLTKPVSKFELLGRAAHQLRLLEARREPARATGLK